MPAVRAPWQRSGVAVVVQREGNHRDPEPAVARPDGGGGAVVLFWSYACWSATARSAMPFVDVDAAGHALSVVSVRESAPARISNLKPRVPSM